MLHLFGKGKYNKKYNKKSMKDDNYRALSLFQQKYFNIVW